MPAERNDLVSPTVSKQSPYDLLSFFGDRTFTLSTSHYYSLV